MEFHQSIVVGLRNKAVQAHTFHPKVAPKQPEIRTTSECDHQTDRQNDTQTDRMTYVMTNRTLDSNTD